MHTINIILRTLFTCGWALFFLLNNSALSEMQRAFFGGVVMADLLTWLLYQIYLLPRNISHFAIGSVINLLMVLILMNYIKTDLPESPEWMGIGIMVFLIVAAIKATYYIVLEITIQEEE